MNYTNEQKMLSLSFLAYAGFWLHGDDANNAGKIKDEIDKGLTSWKPIKGEWELVWGPSVFAFCYSIFDDNAMYVVRNKENPNQYVVAIRGTNPVSSSNWLLEDFNVARLSKWRTAQDPGSLKPKVSEGTRIGLEKLQEMVPPIGMPGQGHTLLAFFQDKLKKNPDLEICFTGHSLGGALSPALALWFNDIKDKQLSPDVPISCVPFAGPSPGNKDFSKYFEKKLGTRCERVFNSLDVVPKGWGLSSLFSMYTLYLKYLRIPGPVMFPVISIAIFLSVGRGYYQIKPSTTAKNGIFNDDLLLYLSQAIYQHTVGYMEVLDIDFADIPLLDVFDLPLSCQPEIYKADATA